MAGRWEVLSRRNLLDCSPWFRVRQETVRLEDGQTIIPDFYVIDSAPYAMVFAVTTDEKVVLIEQYKHGAGRRLLELPAGYIAPGEEPVGAAQRELREETGMVAPEWKPLGTFVQDGNRGCGLCHAYLALGAYPVTVPEPVDLSQQILHLYDLNSLREFWLGGGFYVIGSMGVVGLGLAVLGKEG